MKNIVIMLVFCFLKIPVMGEILDSKFCKNLYYKTKDITFLAVAEDMSDKENQDKLYELYRKGIKNISKLINNNCIIENTHIPSYLTKKSKILERKQSNEKYNKNLKENIEKFKSLAIKIFDIEREINNIAAEGLIDIAKETKSDNYGISDLLLSVASMSIKKDRMNALIAKHNKLARDAFFIYVMKIE